MVYSHRHTSVTTISGIACLMARMACCTIPSEAKFSRPIGSFSAGRPNKITAGMPRLAACSASRTASVTDNWDTPGIEPIGVRPLPCLTKSGYMKSRAFNSTSRNIPRKAGVARNLRGRTAISVWYFVINSTSFNIIFRLSFGLLV